MKKNFIEHHAKMIALAILCLLMPFTFEDSQAYHENISVTKMMETTNQIASQMKEQVMETIPSYVVVIDAGHGGYDDGSVSDGIKEKNITLGIALKIGAILEKKGVSVVYTRDSDEVIWDADNVDDLLMRSEIANESNADLFVSIHLNDSDETDEEIRGFEIWLSYEEDINITFAENVCKQLANVNYSENRGLKDHAMSPLSLLYFNRVPSILIETGFISNKEDREYLVSEDGQKNVANAIAQGILDTLSS